MTDNENIKALECCCVSECDECPYDEQTACVEILKEGTLALINRQKAEIERYKGVIKILENDVKIANIEAVKDFGKFLINQSKPIDGMDIPDYVVDFLKVNNPSVTYGDSSPCTGAPIIVKGSVADEC